MLATAQPKSTNNRPPLGENKSALSINQPEDKLEKDLGSSKGKHLLAHDLTHVKQQRRKEKIQKQEERSVNTRRSDNDELIELNLITPKQELERFQYWKLIVKS